MSHEHSAGHAHHFPSAESQYSAAKLGMWLFLGTELLLFGGLFTAYAVFRSQYPEMFMESHLQLDRTLGTINTLVLILSSYTMALAVSTAKSGDGAKTARNLLITVVLGAVFAVNKYFEYSAKFEHGIYPDENLFFGIYFAMTGLHMLHVFIGMGLILWVWTLVRKGRITSEYYTPVEISGLYWHLVDLIWIYLFPLLYLIG